MKKIQLLVACVAVGLLLTSSLFAQEPKWVSKEVSKRNVVIEEFTGIYCGYCPDGHKRANALVKANPGKVFVANIHTGSYAAPQAGSGHPDLRITEGATIASKAGITGYPAGAVNRSTTPWAMSRTAWANVAAGIMSQNSPVNVFVKPTLDFNTRKLTVEVEVYYTDASASPTNYLTVMLLQNEILGYQSGASGNPDYVTAEGLYRHMHALRMIVSDGGAWGDPITTTTAKHYEYKKYEVVLPEDIKSIPVALHNLEVLAFVAEGNNNIYTAHQAAVEIPADIRTDLSIKDMTEYPATLKFEPFTPKVEIVNNEALEVTKFDVVLKVGEQELKRTFDGKLAKGGTTIITFDEINLTASQNYTLTFAISDNIYAGEKKLIDTKLDNNKASISSYGFVEKAFSLGKFSLERKDNKLDLDNVVLDLSQAVLAWRGWQNENGEQMQCGANNSYGTLLMTLYGGPYKGKTAYIMFGEVDFTQEPKKTLSYHYAYSDGERNGTAPKIAIEASTDWGKTWEKVNEITCSQTGQPPEVNYYYIPTSSEYKKVEVDLKDYANKNALVRIGITAGTEGNAMYIDEIEFSKTLNSIEEEIENIAIYPNPTTKLLQINDESLLNADYEVINAAGNVVLKANNDNNTINLETLTQGAYTLKINGKFFRFIKK